MYKISAKYLSKSNSAFKHAFWTMYPKGQLVKDIINL